MQVGGAHCDCLACSGSLVSRWLDLEPISFEKVAFQHAWLGAKEGLTLWAAETTFCFSKCFSMRALQVLDEALEDLFCLSPPCVCLCAAFWKQSMGGSSSLVFKLEQLNLFLALYKNSVLHDKKITRSPNFLSVCR